MACTDGMIWVGQSYVSILCHSKKSCAIPLAEKERPHCFVHEAECRGCCRKVPMAPAWLVPGKSRIFLAHRGGTKGKERGRISARGFRRISFFAGNSARLP